MILIPVLIDTYEQAIKYEKQEIIESDALSSQDQQDVTKNCKNHRTKRKNARSVRLIPSSIFLWFSAYY